MAAHVPMHDGSPRPNDVELFREPPAEIGRVLSASSNRSSRRQPRSLAERLVPALFVGLAVALSFVGLSALRTRGEVENAGVDQVPIGAVAGGLFAVTVLATFLLRRRSFETSYVGTQGFARFRTSEHGDAERAKCEILLFEKVDELRTTLIENPVNQDYAGTGFIFCWYDEAGPVYEFRGAHHSRTMTPASDHPFHLGVAAAGAWNQIVRDRAREALDTRGEFEFRLFKGASAVVGHGFAEFRFRARVERLEPHEVTSVLVREGTVTIETAERMWCRRGRVCTLDYDEIGNAEVFLELLAGPGGFPVVGPG